ncbi:uncharacterized protein LOC116244776 [Nymphaea colorata]|nr:uncharacterized protein LOC116244776 [Nymphaea colorata]
MPIIDIVISGSAKMTSVFNPTLFKGKLALISGGATGICYEIAKQFLIHGASVYIISRKIENINKAVKSLAEETGNKTFGEARAMTVLMIDTVGTFLLSKYTAELSMKKSGVILNISANLHYSGTALQAHSGTAKAGVDALTKHMAVEFGPRDIRVIGICPGPIQGTEGIDRLNPKDVKTEQLLPLQRLGTKLDVANACLFSASSAASYVTGSIIMVDGGSTLTQPNFAFSSK